MSATDPKTYAKFEAAQHRARQLGRPLVELLEANGLLMSEARIHSIQVQLLADLIRRFERKNPNQLMSFYTSREGALGRADGTAAEMYAAVELWLDTYRTYLVEKRLEEI